MSFFCFTSTVKSPIFSKTQREQPEAPRLLKPQTGLVLKVTLKSNPSTFIFPLHPKHNFQVETELCASPRGLKEPVDLPFFPQENIELALDDTEPSSSRSVDMVDQASSQALVSLLPSFPTRSHGCFSCKRLEPLRRLASLCLPDHQWNGKLFYGLFSDGLQPQQ